MKHRPVGRIESVEVVPYRLAFKTPYLTARGQLTHRDLVLLLVTSIDGIVGLGEAVPLSLRGGAPSSEISRALREWAGRTASKGIPADPPESTPARCAVETALADLKAKEQGIPLHSLLSPGSFSRAIQCNATIGADEPVRAVEEMLSWAEDGFRVFKVKVGTPGDRARLEALFGAVPEGGRIRLDANGAWSVSEAVEILGGLDREILELVEQPTPDLAGMAEVRSATGVVVVADEAVTSPEDARLAARREACDAITVKLSKIGGLDATLGGYLPVYLSSALDGPVGIAAAAHVAATLEPERPFGQLAQGLATERLFEETISADGPILQGCLITPPKGPGIGVELDLEALERVAIPS